MAWQITDDSMVHCECKPALNKPFPAEPQPVHKFLVHLESHGHVRTKLHMHQVKRREDVPGRYEITATEQAVLDVKQDSGAKATIQNIGHFADIKMLKEGKYVSVIHKLLFDAAGNKITCSFPGVFLKENVRMKKGDLVKIAG